MLRIIIVFFFLTSNENLHAFREGHTADAPTGKYEYLPNQLEVGDVFRRNLTIFCLPKFKTEVSL